MDENSNIPLLRLWLERFHRSEDYVSKNLESARENYRMYKAYKSGREVAYKHSIFVPYTFAFVEDMTAYFLLSVLANPSPYSLEPRWGSVSPELCQHLEKIIAWALSDENTEFALELEEVVKNQALYNVSYLINYPSLREYKLTGADGIQVSRDKFDYLYLDAPSPFNTFPEPGPKRLSRSNWIIKRSFEVYENIRQAVRNGMYESADGIKPGDSTSEQDPVQQLLSEIGLSTVEFNENKVELLDCFRDGDVVTVANRRAVIRDTTKDPIRPYPFKFPMLDCRLAGAPGEWAGVGTAEAMKPGQKDLNLLRSQRRDNITLVLNKLFTYDMMAGEVDLSTLYSAPGNVIVQQGDAIKELPIQDVTGSSFKEEQSLLYDLQNVLSFFDYSRGATPRRRETATGIIRLQQAAQSRLEWHLRKLDAYILQPLCRRLLVYLRESLPREDFKGIVGKECEAPTTMSPTPTIEEFYGLSTEDIKRLIAVRPLTEAISSTKEVDTQQFMQAYDRLIRLPIINQEALVRQLLVKLGQRNLKDIFKKLSPGAQDATAGVVQRMKDRPPLPGLPGAPPGPGFGSPTPRPEGLNV